MLGALLWWCLLVSMYRPVPSPRDHYSASWGHESCRRHNIDMSFPHHFLPPPMLLCRTPWSKDGFQWLAWGYLLRDLSVFCTIMLYTFTHSWSIFNLFWLKFGTPCSILKSILTVLLNLIMAHTFLVSTLLLWCSLIQIQTGSWKLLCRDDCILQWNWSVALSAMESELCWVNMCVVCQ